MIWLLRIHRDQHYTLRGILIWASFPPQKSSAQERSDKFSSSGKKSRQKKNTMSEQRKAVIKNADMSEEMQQDAVDIASQALAKYNIEKVSPPPRA